MTDADDAETHRLDSITPLPDGTLLLDCSCGPIGSIPAGVVDGHDESERADQALATHRRLAARTIVYPSVMSRMQAEAAVEVVAAEHGETSLIRQILKLDGPRAGYIADSIELGAETWVVEIGKGPFGDRAPYVVIHESKDTHTFHATLDEALLYAVELRAGGDPDRGGYLFAARMLGVKTAFDATA